MNPEDVGLSIRQASLADVDGLLALWRAGGVDHDEVQDRGEIEAKLDYDGDLFLIGEVDGVIVASVMGTYDGHRGRIKRCVVDPAQQGAGLGQALVADLERRFLARGITELRLEVWADNPGGLAFWDAQGFELLEDIRYFTKSLTSSGSEREIE